MSDNLRLQDGQGVYLIGYDAAAINDAFSAAWSVATRTNGLIYILWDGDEIEPHPLPPDIPISQDKPKSGRAWYHAIDSKKREYRYLRERRR